MSYTKFLDNRCQWYGDAGFDCEDLPDFLYPFQRELVQWALRKGRAAIFADCGLGKTPMQLAWADAVVRRTGRPVLLLTPLAVGAQTMREAAKFQIDAARSRDGYLPSSEKIWITNYEQLHKFDPSSFVGVVCDESSAIKDFKSQTKARVVNFTRRIPFRLLCTATAAPNDYWELGTSSEALGYMGFRDMITTFFKQETTKDYLGWGRTKYRFRGHAERPFWTWVCSWAKCIRKPSDIGYDDNGFCLPPLVEHEHIVSTAKPREGLLFSLPATNLSEQRDERRASITERVDMACEILTRDETPGVAWCELNVEGDQLARQLPDAMQVKGSMDDEEKEEILDGFAHGHFKRLVTKPKIGCWGLNWQHCHNISMFPSHSFEQYYQAVRRCWRFGQQNRVDVHLIVSEGEEGVLKNLRRKSRQADAMFENLRTHMNDGAALVKVDSFNESEIIPSWL